MLIFFILAFFSNNFWCSLENSISKKDNKLIMIYFHMDHCHYCLKMDRQIWQDKDVQMIIQNSFDPVEINVSDTKLRFKINGKQYKAKELSHLLDVDRYPSVLFLDKNGNVKYHLNEYVEKTDFLRLVDKIK